MQLSRWGWSPYETEEDMSLERTALSGVVDVVADGMDAQIVVIHSKIAFGAPQLAAAPSLRLLITTTSGTEHIDLAEMVKRGVTVCRLPMARRDAVVDATVGMLIWGLRRFGTLQRRAADGVWARSELPVLGPVGLSGACIGLVGQGVIGTKVSAVLVALGARVWACDPAGVPSGVVEASVDEMLSRCDAVSLHCDLNPSTRNIISKGRIETARSSLVLVNTARGGLVDVPAALTALSQGGLGALALDVFPDEPYLALEQVCEYPDLMCLPHAAGYHTRLAALVRSGLREAVESFISDATVPHQVA